MKLLAAVTSSRPFFPHETARIQSLAGVPLAAFWQRAVAFVIDFAIVLAIFFPYLIAREYLAVKSFQHALQVELHFHPHDFQDLIWLVAYAGLSVWRSNGRTVGKRLVRIRVLSLRNTEITLWQAVERALGYGASTLEAGFGFVQFFIDFNRQCVHDRIAETIVVLEQPLATPSRAAPQGSVAQGEKN